MTTHTILGGKLRLYRRGESGNWDCATYHKGRKHRTTTKQGNLERAQEKAEDWYLELRGKARAGLVMVETKPFAAATDAFMADYEADIEGQCGPSQGRPRDGQECQYLDRVGSL